MPHVRVPLAFGLAGHAPPAEACPMTTTEATTADLALTELHEHLAAIERLARAPFNAERIELHRSMALECLDAIATQLAG